MNSKTIKAQFARLDKRIEKNKIADNKAFVDALPAMVAKHPNLEWRIVSNYLEREQKVVVDSENYESLARRADPHYAQLTRTLQNRKGKAKRP